jgi:hypothetical protein
MKLYTTAALLMLTLSAPLIAENRQHSPAAHMRPQLFHDRTPHVHNRAAIEKHGK